MKTTALIPARCGSKGIPFKNIHLINGKPMISYSIEALKNSIVDEIYVSTDCSEIKSVAIHYGAKIIDRPTELSRDESKTIECIKHAISFLKMDSQDTIALVQPTSPMITSSDVTNGIDTFNLGSHDIVIAVVERHSILWEQKNNSLVPKNHDLKNRARRQDMNKIFSETGSLYVFGVKNVIKYGNMYGLGNVGYIEIPKSRSFEIDDYEDINIVESIMKSNF